MVNKTRIALGMSGGVDSAVSASLLMRAGYEVVGVTCLFFDDERSVAAARDAAAVCEQLDIEHHVYDGIACFTQKVIEPFVQEYAKGLTPSPCVSCNASCKVPLLLEAADSFGCKKIATGHYARVAQLMENDRFVIKTALDVFKDQSYMLSQLNQEQLARLVLPLGAMTKAEVRVIAEDIGLAVAQKPESQDICFVEGSHLDFLRDHKVEGKTGNIVTTKGEKVGTHEGLFAYTIGQRKGIGIAAAEPYYVVGKNPEENKLIIGFKDETYISEVSVDSLNWQAFDMLEENLDCMVKLRYRSRTMACTVEPVAEGVRVKLLSPQPTTAPGQFAVFYQGETLLGGGVITAVR